MIEFIEFIVEAVARHDLKAKLFLITKHKTFRRLGISIIYSEWTTTWHLMIEGFLLSSSLADFLSTRASQ